MVPTPSRRRFLAAVGAAFALAGCVQVPGGSRVERGESLTEPVGDATGLSVSNRNGDVTAESADVDAVEVEVTRRGPSESALDRVAVETRRDAGSLTVETVAPDAAFADVAVDLDVRVPAGLAAERVGTRNGDATLRGTTGDATVATANGDATAEDVDGAVTLRTVNGDATAARTAGFAGASAVNGDVDVEVRGMDADAAAETTNGEVSAAVDASLDLDVLLETSNGALAVEGMTLRDATYGGYRVSGRLNGGGHRLRARTGNGRVELGPLDG